MSRESKPRGTGGNRIAASILNETRVNEVDAPRKLAGGLTQNASTAHVVALGGVTLTPSDLVAKVQARIALVRAVSSAQVSRPSTVQTDKNAPARLEPLLSAVKKVLLAAFFTQVEVLADLGLTPRKKVVVFAATKTAAAPKAKATRAARVTKGTAQKAAITTQVTIDLG